MFCRANKFKLTTSFTKLQNANDDIEHLREEKDQEIMILQESVDSTLQQLNDAQQVYHQSSSVF